MKASCKLLLLGLSHASVKGESHTCFGVDENRRKSLELLLDGCVELNGRVVLNTCNRMELYASLKKSGTEDSVKNAFFNGSGLAGVDFERDGYLLCDEDAVRHLMEVCAGLDSRMIGETEILGQVKQAYAEASGRGFADAVLHHIFQKSFSAAKHARENSGISVGRTSLGSVASEVARRIYGDFSRCKVLVVGSGRVGTDVAGALKIRGARDICVASRTRSHSETLATEIGAAAVDFEKWADAFRLSDIAIFGTSSGGLLLTRKIVEAVMKERRGRNLLVIDLAVPKNVETAVGNLPDVFLYTFENLADAVNESLRGREREIDVCRTDLADRAFSLWKDTARRFGEALSARTAK